MDMNIDARLLTHGTAFLNGKIRVGAAPNNWLSTPIGSQLAVSVLSSRRQTATNGYFLRCPTAGNPVQTA